MSGQRIVWKLSRQCGNCPDSVETVQRVWKMARQCGNGRESLEIVRTAWKLSGQSENCLDSLKTVVVKHIGLKKGLTNPLKRPG